MISKRNDHCRKCGAPVDWVRTASGALIAMNPGPTSKGPGSLPGNIAHMRTCTGISAAYRADKGRGRVKKCCDE